MLSRNVPPQFLAPKELLSLHNSIREEANERTFSIISKRVDFISKENEEVIRFGPYMSTYLIELSNCALRSSKVFAEAIMLTNRSIFNVDVNSSINFGGLYGIGHTSAIVIGGITSCGPGVFFNHGVTVGRFGNDRPIIGSNVILMPHSIVVGNSRIGQNSIISAGVKIVNRTIPSNSLVLNDASTGAIVIKKSKKDYWRYFFRD